MPTRVQGHEVEHPAGQFVVTELLGWLIDLIVKHTFVAIGAAMVFHPAREWSRSRAARAARR